MATVSIDPKIKLRLCPELKDITEEVFGETLEILDVAQVQEMRAKLKESDVIQQPFHRLLSKCELIVPKPELAPRNPELEARIQKLKAAQEQREYDKMTYNVDPGRQAEIKDRDDKPVSKQLEEINRYLVLIFQFVLSIASSFAFGYLAPFYFYGTVAVGPRLLYGIISGFVVGIADLYFVMRHLLETEGVISVEGKTGTGNPRRKPKAKQS